MGDRWFRLGDHGRYPAQNMKAIPRNFSLLFLLGFLACVCVGLALMPIIVKHYNWTTTKRELIEYTRSDEYLKYGYPETMAAARPIYQTLVDGLIECGPDATIDDKNALMKQLTYDLYHLDENVETVEREQFYDTTWGIAYIVGVGSTPEEGLDFEQKLMEWRD